MARHGELDTVRRFSDRASDYVKYRPTYPAEALSAILDGLGPPGTLVAADVGAGTGISARLLGDRGLKVIAVEPGEDMRRAAAPHPRVAWVAGTAEATGLRSEAADLVLCGVHRTLHNVPLLWRWTHQMHHSAERMDLAGLSYTHPFDTLLTFALTTSFLYALVEAPGRLLRYAIVIAVMAVLRCGYAIYRTRRLSFLLFVCYGFLHLALLGPKLRP